LREKRPQRNQKSLISSPK